MNDWLSMLLLLMGIFIGIIISFIVAVLNFDKFLILFITDEERAQYLEAKEKDKKRKWKKN
jgi:hypothetical protein